MAAHGSTVVFTTHSVQDIESSDRVVVLAPGGRVLSVGTPTEVLEALGATTFGELYASVAGRAPEEPSPTGLHAGTARPATRPESAYWALMTVFALAPAYVAIRRRASAGTALG